MGTISCESEREKKKVTEKEGKEGDDGGGGRVHDGGGAGGGREEEGGGGAGEGHTPLLCGQDLPGPTSLGTREDHHGTPLRLPGRTHTGGCE